MAFRSPLNGNLLFPSQEALTLEQVASVVVGNSPSWLYVAGDVLYVTVTNDAKIRAYDISGQTPSHLGDVTVGTNTGWIEQRGRYLYATDVNAAVLRVIDVSDPTSMTVKTTLTVDSSGAGIQGRFAAGGNLLCIGGPASGVNANLVYIVDVSAPLTPSVAGSVASGGSTLRDVAYLGGSFFAICSRDDHTVKIIDASTPASPTVAASLTTTQSNTTTALAAQGDYLYVGNYGNGSTLGGFEIWDVTSKTAPVQAGVLATVGGSEQMTVRGEYAYVGCRQASLTGVMLVVDVRNPARPVLAGSLSAGSFACPGVAVTNGYAYRTSSEASGSANGKVLVCSVQDNLAKRVSAIETLTQAASIH